VIAVLSSAPGYLASAFGGKWGEEIFPPQYRTEEYKGRLAQFYTLWSDLESVYAFSYNGFHAQALRKRKEWFIARPQVSYVTWWVDDSHIPTWQEGCDRYVRLVEFGASPEAFDFRHPFGADGQPTELDRERTRQLAAHYRNQKRSHHDTGST
jgi:hypothetical protein